MADQLVPSPGSSDARNAGRDLRLERIAQRLAGNLTLNIVLLSIVLVGLPVAVWLDLRELSESALRRQAQALSVVIDRFREYYANNVVERVLAHPGGTVAVANYQDVPGAIPIPATLSLEVGNKLSETSSANHMGYRFFSDYPFPPRAFHKFDPFERDALKLLREKKETSVYDVSGSILDRKVRLITPIKWAPAASLAITRIRTVPSAIG
jgi:hypothetical protein